jgi:uncharacterized coiled-coil protein SlyX
MKETSDQITDIQIQLTHMIKTIEELNDVILEQQKSIEKINRINQMIMEGFKEIGFQLDFNLENSSNMRPPHY